MFNVGEIILVLLLFILSTEGIQPSDSTVHSRTYLVEDQSLVFCLFTCLWSKNGIISVINAGKESISISCFLFTAAQTVLMEYAANQKHKTVQSG